MTENEIRTLHEKFNELHLEKELQLREKTLARLSSYDYKARCLDLSERRVDGTGEWLF